MANLAANLTANLTANYTGNFTGSLADVFVPEPKVCQVGGSGVVLPVGGDDEQEWANWLRALLYGVGMVYFFVGVAIVADCFVASIETVTARKRQRRGRNGSIVTEKVWNDIVATLSLMALGSSAPEIALSVVDLFKKDFHFAPLGAQTIAGSAAFNLLIIVAVCIVVIPSTETRKIQELAAFYVTAAVSVFAYFWLVFILIIWSPNVVEIPEAVATFLFLPMLIWVSYKVDVGDMQKLFARLTGGHWRGSDDDDKDLPSVGFEEDELLVEVSEQESKVIRIAVKRPEGAAGPFAVAFRTEHLRAVPGFDYMSTVGTLSFAPDEAEQAIELEVLPRPANRVDRKLLVLLEDAEGCVGFDADTDGGKDSAVMTVTIRGAGAAPGGGLARSVESFLNYRGLELAKADWKDQVLGCLYVNGSPEEQKEASALDWVSHLLSLPWKLCFSLLPPVSLWGGWATFYFALAAIGALTIFISDLAELFGCVVGLQDDITAIVFVALGTSMPDLFASYSAAREEPTADASIVNVTGSNSVNVFLGLGLPWTIGSIYWKLKGQTPEWIRRYATAFPELTPDVGGTFVVESRNLGFCVLVFGMACAVALLILHLRRKLLGAELGGPFVPKITVFVAFVLFWFGFIGVASWRISRGSSASSFEMAAVLGGVGGLELVVAIVAIAVTVVYKIKPEQRVCKKASGSNLFRRTVSAQSSGSRISGGSSSIRGSMAGSLQRSPSGLSNTSSSSRRSNEKRLHKSPSSSSLSEGVLGVNRSGIGHHVLKPRFAYMLNEPRI